MAGSENLSVVVPTGRHGLPPDIVAAHQRQRLLAATIELVAIRGYRGTSIDNVVKTAKVGYVAFYELFESKDACFEAAFESIVTETREELAAAVSPGLPWAEQICAGLAKLVDLIVADPARARVGLIEAQAAGAAAYRRYEEAIDSAVPKLREGRAFNPEAAALSETLEEAILGGIAWIFHQRLVRGESERIEGLLAEAIQIALSPYLGEAEAQRIAAAAAMGT
jgi:AcrR family transcriptional regulator